MVICMQEFTIFGIKVKDYTQKESLRLLGEYLDNGGLNIVSYLNTQMLVESETDEQCRTCLNALDMTIIAEPDIIKAAEQIDSNRIKEVGSGFIIKSLTHRVAKHKMSVYLIAATWQELNDLENELRELQPSLKVVGKFAFNENNYDSAQDVMVNDINGLAPTVIISRLPYRKQLQLMYDNQKRVNSELWLGLLQGIRLAGLRKHGKTIVNSFFYRKLFHRKISKYKNENSTAG